MTSKPVVIVISDLHMGGGASDRGDDHVFDHQQLERFITDELLSSPDGQAGRIELYINGDGFEFAQVRPEVYRLRSAHAWCSEEESLAKLKPILEGHAGVFAAMRAFSERGNIVTLAAGNHDVDLFWSGVQARLREVAGDLQFVLGDEWTTRFDGRLQISHGHQYDRANRFKHWSSPFVEFKGESRLEMCPGTLFMVKFVNELEEKFPFADNIKPITALGPILRREKKLGWLAFMILRFGLRHPRETMGSVPAGDQLPRLLVESMACDPTLCATVRGWYRSRVKADASNAEIKDALLDPESLADFLMLVMAEENPESWRATLDPLLGIHGTLGESTGTLQVIRQGMVNDKDLFREKAQERMLETGAQVVVLGHTHCPDNVPMKGGKYYFNPGSWTRYAEIDKQHAMTMADLTQETTYPYHLNYVRVQLRADDTLDAVMLPCKGHP